MPIKIIWINPNLVIDVKDTLLEHVQNLYNENSPELVYYVTLYHLFNEKLINMDEIARIKEKTGIHNTKIWNMLYNFQHDDINEESGLRSRLIREINTRKSNIKKTH